MPLSPGARVGPYEVVSVLGSGGMGEVYRARDTRLGRDVALKVVSAAFTADAERLARFEREAQVLATLNHPHIAQIYAVEEGALVMELVDAGTLADRLTSGPIPVADALAIAKQVADALEAAHEKGIIHRDLKPSNIAFTADGQAKVLDFGLAKLAAPDGQSGASSTLSLSPTITSPALMTGVGVLLGTAAYMAPEQVKGREADKRSDVWAFGCVLYEMLTGVRPFEAEDVAETLAYTLTKEPDWAKLPADLPAPVATLLRRCMVKDRRRRTGDIAAAQFVFEESANLSAPAPAAPPPAPPATSHWRRTATTAALFVVAIALTAVAVWTYQRRTIVPPAPQRFTVTPAPPILVDSPGAVSPTDRALAITPDGTRIIYRAGTQQNSQIMVRALNQLEAQPLPGITAAREPVPSPDGNWIAFFTRGELRKVSVNGGPSILLARVTGNPRGMTWADDDTLLYSIGDSGASASLRSVPAGGGEAKLVLAPDQAHGEAGIWLPSALPGSQAVLYTTFNVGQAPAAGVVGYAARAASDNGQIGVFDRRTGQRKIVLRGGADAHYTDSGHLVYTAAGAIRAVPFDLARLEVTGDPIPLVDGVRVGTTAEAEFAVSRTGTLVYIPGADGSGAVGQQFTLAWVDRSGHEEPLAAPPRSYTYPRVSPDGTKLLLDIRDQETDLWTWDFARQTLTRLTFDPGIDRQPIWAPDGKRVFFASQRNGAGPGNIFVQSADGTGTAERLTTSEVAQFPMSVSPDGLRIVFRQDSTATGQDLMLLTLGAPGSTAQITPLVQTMFNELNGQISPDGKWLAYESDESGQKQIYVRPFPDVNAGRWQVSPGGGTRPLWGRNGRELFYLNLMDKLTAVPVQTTPTFTAGNPVMLFKNGSGTYVVPNNGVTYDVSPDGQKFLMIKGNPAPAGATGPPPNMVFVLNWFQELRQRVMPK